MAKKNNGLSNIVNQLGSPKIGGLRLSKLLEPVNLVNQQQDSAGSAVKIPSLGSTRTLSLSAKDTPTGIKFGTPSNSRVSTSQSSSVVTNLLKQTASGGIASVLSGGLASFSGIGGLVSGLISVLGGGKSAPPPLVEFQLPQSEEQTVYVSPKGSTNYQGTDVEQPNMTNPMGSIYTGTSQAGSPGTGGQALQYQSSQIAQAVKNALLNSSSLNDVIAEI